MADINAQQVVSQLSTEIINIKDKLKDEKLSDYAFSELSKNAKYLQDKIDNILKKGGLVTKDDVADAYTALQETKRKELKKLSRRMVINISGGLVAIVGAIIVINRITKKA